MANIGPNSLGLEKQDSPEVSFPNCSLHDDAIKRTFWDQNGLIETLTFREANLSNFPIDGPPEVLVTILICHLGFLASHCNITVEWRAIFLFVYTANLLCYSW